MSDGAKGMSAPVTTIDLSEVSAAAGTVFAANIILVVFALVGISVEAGALFFSEAGSRGSGHWWDDYVAGPVAVLLMGVYLWLGATADYSELYWRRHAMAGAVFSTLLIGGIIAGIVSIFELSWAFLIATIIFLIIFAPIVVAALGLLGSALACLEARLNPDDRKLTDVLGEAETLREALAAQRKSAPPRIPFIGRVLSSIGSLGIAALAAAFLITGVFEDNDPTLSDAAAGVGGLLVLSLPVFGILLILGARLSQPNARTLLANDRRPPTLLLRSFGDDPAKVPPRNVLRKVLFWGLGNGIRLETAIANELSMAGPLVAVGKPGERLPQLGAARGYYEHDEWQDEVLGWMNKARVVAMIAGRTQGVTWELQQLIAGGHLGRTILLFPPDTPEGKSERWAVVANCLATAGIDVRIEDAVVSDLLAVHFIDGGTPTCLRSQSAGQVDYELVVRMAIAGLGRGVRHAPRH